MSLAQFSHRSALSIYTWNSGCARSAAVEEGDDVFLTLTDKEMIPIGDGNRYPEIYEPIEAALSRPMVPYLRGFLRE